MTMQITRRGIGRAAAGAATTLIASPHVARAAFPERTLHIMVGFAAGGTVDTIARILANAAGPLLGQSMVVENRPGGSGSIAANAVVQAPPDGHTLLFGIFPLAVAPALARLTYDTLKDFTAVSQVASVPLLMFASQKSPYRSLADVVSAAKAAPDTVTYASGGRSEGLPRGVAGRGRAAAYSPPQEAPTPRPRRRRGRRKGGARHRDLRVGR